MPPTPNIQLNHGDVAIEPFFDATQQVLTGSAPSLALTLANSTTVQAVASGDNDLQAVAIQGRYRWVDRTVTAGHPGGARATYDVYVTASDNDFTLGESTVDETDYAFGLTIRAAGNPPTTALYRKVAEVDWSGTAITALRHLVGQRRDSAPINPTAPIASFTPLRVRAASGQSAPLAVFEDSTGSAMVYVGGTGGIGVTSGPLFLAPSSGNALTVQGSGDTGPRLEINNQGRIRLGRGDGSFDITLQRDANAALALTGAPLSVAHDIRIAVPSSSFGFKVRNSADTADWFVARQSSDRLLLGQATGWQGVDLAPGSGNTVSIASTGTVTTPAAVNAGTSLSAGTTISAPGTTIDASGNITTNGNLWFARPYGSAVIFAQQTADTDILTNRLIAADDVPAFGINGAGDMRFGAGGSRAVDVTLRRVAAGKLQIHGQSSTSSPGLVLGRARANVDGTLAVSGGTGAWGVGDTSGDIVLLSSGSVFIGRLETTPVIGVGASGSSPTLGFFGATPVVQQATQYTNSSGLLPARTLPASYTMNQLAQLVLALVQDLGRHGFIRSAF